MLSSRYWLGRAIEINMLTTLFFIFRNNASEFVIDLNLNRTHVLPISFSLKYDVILAGKKKELNNINKYLHHKGTETSIEEPDDYLDRKLFFFLQLYSLYSRKL